MTDLGQLPWQFIPALQPAPAEGVYFRRQSVRYFDRLPLGSRPMFGAAWFDIETDRQVGSMCHVVVEMAPDRRFYLVELWHARTDIDSAIQAMFQIQQGLHIVELWKDREPDRARIYGPKRWFIAQEQYDAGLKERINVKRVRVNERVQHYADRFRIAVSPFKDRMTLPEVARAVQADLVTENLLLPKGAPWIGQLESELFTWPASPTASRVAALGLIAAARNMIHPGRERASPQQPRPGSTWMSE